ncbi:hypothetical protein EON63_24400 [archaeon]|nr:MAG: hypothetical protein EON63_24400 [archaeon]
MIRFVREEDAKGDVDGSHTIICVGAYTIGKYMFICTLMHKRISTLYLPGRFMRIYIYVHLRILITVISIIPL